MNKKLPIFFTLLSITLITVSSQAQTAAKVYFNFGKTYNESSPWNNAGQDPNQGTTFGNLLDDQGNNTNMSVTLTTAYGGVYDQGATTGNNSGVVPDNVLKEYYWFGAFGAPDEVRFKVSGLVPGAPYNFTFVGSSNFRSAEVTDNGNTVYTIGTASASLYVDGNTANDVQLNNIMPDNNGEVEVVLTKAANASVGYINAMIVELPQGMLYKTSGTASYAAGTGVTLSWTDNNSSETGYEIYRANLVTGGGLQLLTTLPANSTTFPDSNVSEGYRYEYKIRAVSATQQAAFSNSITRNIPLQAGSNFTVGNQVYFNFGKSATASAPWNNAGRDPGAGVQFSNLQDQNANNTGLSIELITAWGGTFSEGAVTGNNSGVVPDSVLKEYYWFGFLDAPNEVSFRIKGLTPAASYNLHLLGSSVFHQGGLTDNGHTIYTIGDVSQSMYVEANTSNFTTFQNITANNQGEIIVYLTKGADAIAGYINALIIDLPDGMLYPAPKFKGSYETGAGVNLTWTDNNSSETGYQVYRKDSSPGSTYSLVATTSPDATSYLDNTVAQNTLYYYKIRTVNGSTASGYTSEVQVKTFPVKKLYFNFGNDLTAPSPWNNAHRNPATGSAFNNLLDENGANTGLSLKLTTAWGGAFNEGAITGNNTGVVPDDVLKEYYWSGLFGSPDEAKFRIDGLDPDLTYNLKFIGSSLFRYGTITNNGTTIYRIGSAEAALYVEGNTDEAAGLFDVQPDSNGRIEVTLVKGPNTATTYINALIVELPETMLYAPVNMIYSYAVGGGVSMAWEEHNGDETGYEIYRQDETNAGPYTLLTTLAANATSYVDNTVVQGNSYHYKIRAVRNGDASVYSKEIVLDCIPKKKVYFNFGLDYAAATPWNNAAKNPNAGVEFKNLRDADGNTTTVEIELLTSWGGVYNEGATTSDNSGVAPDAVLQEYYWFGVLNGPEEARLKVKGLTPGKRYNFSFLGSSLFHNLGITNNGQTDYTINGQTASLEVEANTSEYAELKNITADNEGAVEVTITKGAGATVGYINAMIIEIPDVDIAYWAVQNGNWSDPIWNHNKTAGTGNTIPAGSRVNIEGKTVNLTASTIADNLTISSSAGQPGVLIVDGATLTNRGTLSITNTNTSNRIELINSASLRVQPEPLRIMPLGNSITQGSSTTYTYRYSLWKKLIDDGVQFDYVGSQTTNNEGNPSYPPYQGRSFDPENEGHWGWRADEIAQHLPAWLAGNRPDIVLLHAGTNDLLQSQSVTETGDDIRNIIDILRTSNPSVKILLAKLIPNANTDVAPLNAVIGQIVTEKNTTTSPVVLVDQYTGFSAAQDTYDGTHPNTGGEEKMAEKWRQAIATLLTNPSPPNNGNLPCGEEQHSDQPVTLENTYVAAGCTNTITTTGNVVLGQGFHVEEGGTSTFTSNVQEAATPEDVLDNFAFQYQYDARKRMIKKKVPGADWVYMVYDNRDRLVMTQDGNQRRQTPPEWTFTKYDALNRPILTGIYKDINSKSQEQMQTDVNTFYGTHPYYETLSTDPQTGIVHGYTNQSFPDVSDESDYLTVTYYDNYTCKALLPTESETLYDYDNNQLPADNGDPAQEATSSDRVTGQMTAAKVKNLDTGDWLWTVNYYDKRYRPIQSVMQNHLGGTDRVTSVYDFPGRVLRTKTTHTTGEPTEHTVTRKFVYDHASRLLQTWYKVDDAADYVLLSSNEYNELGQVVTKKLHSTEPESTPEASRTYKQDVDYRYNIRGWLTRINNSDLNNTIDGGPRDYFGMNLIYNETDADLNNTPQFNGNISATKWSTNLGLGFNDADLNIFEPTERGYKYDYDALNRLTASTHQERTTGWNEAVAYHEDSLKYDLNGNILKLHRTGKGGFNMDLMDYAYNGNQLLKVDDIGNPDEGFKDGNTTGNDYAYDANGNMIIDKNKDIDTIEYNYLNLPQKVIKKNGAYVKYVYNAAGLKLSQEVYDSLNTLQKKTDYLGEFFYENDTLQFIQHEEGRVIMKETEPEYQYVLKDHLGNARVTFTTKHETETYTATLEDDTQAQEQNDFNNYSRITNDLLDHTDMGTTYDKVLVLNGGYNGQIGLAKSFAVVPGDTIRASVYAKYIGGTGGSGNLANFGAALTEAFNLTAGIPGEAGMAYDALNSYGAFIASGGKDDEENWPKGFLNILVFNKDFELVDVGYQQLDDEHVQSGSVKAQHQLLSRELVIRQAGYVYVYLSNEGEFEQQIGFDDYSVTLAHSDVIQQDEYFSFGMSISSLNYLREGSKSNPFLYNSMELQDELDLGWYDYLARQYDPETGRFLSVDPLADIARRWSPYVYAFDNPIRFVDPDGMASEECEKCKDRVVNQEQSVEITSMKINYDDDGNMVSVSVNFSLTNVTDIETVNEDGEVVSKRREAVTSEETANYGPNGGFQVNKNTGEPINMPTNYLVVAGDNDATKVTVTFPDQNKGIENRGKPELTVEKTKTEASRVTQENAEHLSSSAFAYADSQKKTVMKRYSDFILSTTPERKSTSKYGAPDEGREWRSRARRRRDSLNHSFDSLKQLHKSVKGK